MDCGRDDYYFPGTPPSTNYLSTHWNTANSGFLTPLGTGDPTPPTVTGRTPAANATGVSVGTTVTATFSEPVQGVSGTTFTLRTSAGAAVSATVSYNATTRVATLDPTANLSGSTSYTATLTGGSTAIRDTAGNPLVTTNWSFTTAGGDTIRPTVTARSPAVNATVVAPTANVTATFSEPVQGVGTATFTLKNSSGTSVAAAVAYNATTRVATLNPSANLAPDRKYTATLTGSSSGIRDMAGNTLATTSWTFLTGPRPVVTARSPASGATGVSRTANVTSTFSEAVQGVSGTTFTLRNPAGTVITAVVSYNATTRVATLNPSATLAAGTRYTVRLTGGTSAIRDVAGNPLATTSWSFTTGA
jgi:methionine-rich copper-binding protein CopC